MIHPIALLSSYCQILLLTKITSELSILIKKLYDINQTLKTNGNTLANNRKY